MGIEDIEIKLKKKLEEIERLKRRLKELEEEERELLDDLSKLGFPRGSVVAKYVRCGKEGCRKCPHGPYYYLVWKEGGKTKWKYLGKVMNEVGKVKPIVQRLKEIQKEKRKIEKLSSKLFR